MNFHEKRFSKITILLIPGMVKNRNFTTDL